MVRKTLLILGREKTTPSPSAKAEVDDVREHGLNYFVFLNLFFLLLQCLFIYSKAGNFITSISLPWRAYQEIIITIGIHIGLYVLLALFQSLLLSGIQKRRWRYFSTDTWIVIIWSLSITTILSANGYFFPLSIFSKLLPIANPTVYLTILVMSSLALSLLILNSHYRTRIFALILIPLIFQYISFPPKTLEKQGTSQKNIILIGIDSLSPENIHQDAMPFVSQLLPKGVIFTHTISPLARTYPAWTSILTGLYPKHHHARENLIEKEHVLSDKSIAWILKKHGYNTVFATDDRRFNNLDTEFGFNQIIGPKTGVNDVLIGSFNDLPLSNLLTPFKISSWLFPYNYINRASFYNYYPQSFSTKLKSELTKQPKTKPLFLAVHFTLPHWPYAWAQTSPKLLNDEFGLKDKQELYQDTLHQVDKQISALFAVLQKEHLLDNSVVILLSDHGEELYYPNSRQTNLKNYQATQPSPLANYFKTQTATDLDKSAGHGSDLLSPKQYHSLLGFYFYKNNHIDVKPANINTRVALIDLAPTILDAIQIKATQSFDGVSLWNTIENPKQQPPDRTFYLESGMFPNQDISREKAMELGKRYYQVNLKTDAIELRPEKINQINQQKIYGIIQGDWILALYPEHDHYIPVIQNLVTGEWSDQWSDAYTTSTPAHTMYEQLKDFYLEPRLFPALEGRK